MEEYYYEIKPRSNDDSEYTDCEFESYLVFRRSNGSRIEMVASMIIWILLGCNKSYCQI